MKRLSLCILSLVFASTVLAGADEGAAEQGDRDAVLLRTAEGGSANYQLRKPAEVKLPVESGGYFHPLTTPAGVVVTDVAPADHPHHRGVFLAWVEMHGKKDADFWGWGEHAPTKNRRIVNRGASDSQLRGNVAGFVVNNQWMADDEAVVDELMTAAVIPEPSANAYVLDLMYQVRPAADLTLSRWAFSGFCVRTRGDAKVVAYSPAGEVKLPNPSHVKPESDWPDAAWYGYSMTLPDGKAAGVAVINHPDNPKTLWHNHRDIRMLNPCVVAPAEIRLKADQPLLLRYRVVVHDGPTPVEQLNRLAEKWRGVTNR